MSVLQKSTIYWSIFDLPHKEAKLGELQKQAENPDLWNDSQQAQKLMKQLSELRDEVEGWRKLEKRIHDSLELAEMGDESFRQDIEKEVNAIEPEVEKRELNTLLAGPYDAGNALLTINSGAGGTDSQDWAGMLERMYLRWAERRGFEAEILDFNEGEEAGNTADQLDKQAGKKRKDSGGEKPQDEIDGHRGLEDL